MIDFAKQIENLGAEMTEPERQLAIINGIQNNLGILIDWVQRIDLRLQTLEENSNE
ncbi:MAG: hypothetical protein QX196_07585 [Methylococcaceae bacterium]